MYQKHNFYNQWLRMGFGPNFNEYESHTPLFYDYQYNIQRKIQSPFEEAVIACKKLNEQSRFPIALGLSGGVDSQAVALALKESKIPFEIYIFNYKDKNSYDIVYAKEFCEKHKLKYNEIILDLERFHENKQVISYARKWKSTSPHLACHLKAIERITEKTFIVSGNPVIPKGYKGNNFYSGMHSYSMMGYTRYLSKRLDIIGFFFSYTPELHYSFCSLSEFEQSFQKYVGIDEQINKIDNDYSDMGYDIKCNLYELGGFDITRQEKKYHGFEWLKLQLETNSDYWKNGIHIYDEKYRLPLEEELQVSKKKRAFWNKSLLGENI